MIHVKPTEKHLENIDKYKKWFEKWDMWKYAYKNQDNYYFLVLYERPFKGISGYVFLDEKGEVISFPEAVKSGTALINFNTNMHELITQTLPQMKKNPAAYEALLRLLKDFKHAFVKVDAKIESAIDRIIAGTEETLQMNPVIEEIYYEIGYMQREVTKERGYLDDDLLMKINDRMLDIRTILYGYGLREFRLNPDYQQVLNVMKKNQLEIPESNFNALKGNIMACIRSNHTTLVRSMRTFEVDFDGNKVYIDPNDVKGSLQKKSEKSIGTEFQKLVVPLIRNPK